uniref:Nudix hydrolase domain-containing protein n=1 Tax=Alexandrium monilatum TaxID=311494 RepID=A0A7S4QYH0_9DINO
MTDGHPRSQEAVSEDGRRWRKCAGACIVNSKGHVLVGERLKIAGAWNCPQGGMDDNGESALDAAAREAFEECGLRLGEHIVAVATQAEEEAVRYEAGGWLAQAGFAGQQLHWSLFRCLDAEGDCDAMAMASLQGLGGEAPEFSKVRWQPLEEVVEAMWPAKQPPYRALQKWVEPVLAVFRSGIEGVDFTGTWARDNSRSVGLVEAMQARGHAADEAVALAAKPYVQAWRRGPAPSEWTVATFKDDDTSAPPRRELVYPLGTWEERYEGDSTLFGSAGGTVERRTAWLPEANAQLSPEGAQGLLLAPSQVAHTTASATRLGHEVASRFLRGGELVLRRRFLPTAGSPAVVSEEVFVRMP